ncbi:hypothetical protein X975_23065, partial [Stegodyphus mimosarum]
MHLYCNSLGDFHQNILCFSRKVLLRHHNQILLISQETQ